MIADGVRLDRHGRQWPKGYALCDTCGQPDNSGDCTHTRLSSSEVLEIASGESEPLLILMPGERRHAGRGAT